MIRLLSAPMLAAAFALLAAPARAQRLDATYGGSNFGDFNGSSVSSGFDCDGDGVDDVAVGAPYSTPVSGFTGQGIVTVYSGASHALLGSFTYYSPYAAVGTAVALVGDIDGDGFGDVVVGAPEMNNWDGYVAAWSVKTNTVLWSIYGATGEKMGMSVAAAGDVDKDGHMDVIVGATGGDNVYLFGWGTGALHAWHGTQSGAKFGASVSGNVDVDGDGTLDVIVGTPWYDSVFPFKQDRGRVDVYSGATYSVIWTGLGDNAGDQLGVSVLGLGDVNGDGRAEVLAGTPDADVSAPDSGMVRKYDGTGAKLVDLLGSAAGEEFGYSLARVPDMTGDGLPEYVVGATQNASGGFAALEQGDNDARLWTFAPPDPSDIAYGYATGGGDLDGDGLGDVVVSDPARTVNGVPAAGAADVWITVNATAVNYGAGYPGTLGIPSLAALNDPGIGTTFTAGVTNSRGITTIGLVIVGFTRISVPTSAGGTLLVAPFEILPISVPPTGTLLSGSIPNDTSLLGVVVDLQVLELDPGAAHKLSFTDGLELEIGVDYP